VESETDRTLVVGGGGRGGRGGAGKFDETHTPKDQGGEGKKREIGIEEFMEDELYPVCVRKARVRAREEVHVCVCVCVCVCVYVWCVSVRLR